MITAQTVGHFQTNNIAHM